MDTEQFCSAENAGGQCVVNIANAMSASPESCKTASNVWENGTTGLQLVQNPEGVRSA